MSITSQEQAVLTLGRLTVVPSPAGVADKESFLRSPELAFWLDKQRVSYDYTFLHAPPILRHADGTLASVFCDGARGGVEPGTQSGPAPLSRALPGNGVNAERSI